MAATKTDKTEKQEAARHDAHHDGHDKKGAAKQAEGRRGERKGGGDHGEAPKITAKNMTAEERKFVEKHGHQLSPSTLRAKWLHGPDEHEDRPGQTLATRDHDVIRRWAEERQGEPATVATKNTKEDRPRVLRINFPGYSGRGRLEPVSWDDWFRTFDERQVVFLFQEHMKAGNQSNFFRLDSPKREDA